MKYLQIIHLLIVLAFLTSNIYSQSLPAYFLKEYDAAKTDRQKGMIVINFVATNNDSIKSRSLMLLSYFNKNDDQVGADYTKVIVDIVLNNSGAFTNSLKESFDILGRFKIRKDELGKMWALAAIANSYATSKNYVKAIEYYKQELEVTKLLKDSSRYVNTINDIGYTYALANMPDSGLVYAQQAVDLSDSYRLNLAYSLSTLGENYMVKGEYEKALPFIRKASTYLKNDVYATAGVYNDFLECFIALNNLDSVLHYAQRAIDISKKNNLQDNLLRAYENLYKFFDKTKNNDRSNKYFRLATSIKDSLYSIEKIKIVENLSFNQQLSQQEEEHKQEIFRNSIKQYLLLAALSVFLIIAFIFYRNNKQKQKANLLLTEQKQKVESTLSELRSAQALLIQKEKMASLGELTAGIAHEIQNPLNFVNNFSEVNKEMLEELKAERLKLKAERDDDLQNNLINDIIANEEKINHHGKRADSIVKGMLEHSRTSTGIKEPTDINKLADEYLRLSYHGLRAKDKEFNADFKTDFNESIDKINIVPQDIGRVLLNLFNNAFYATTEKKKTTDENYKPLVSLQTKKLNDKIEIRVSDNGNGIPQNIIDKIFQPFFTTKPTGQGTGLGLSLSYDIIKAHGGEIKVETKEGKGSVFIINLPV